MLGNRHCAIAVAAFALLIVAARPASAQAESSDGASTAQSSESSESWPKFGLGVRFGGHGFRHVDNARSSWDDCRMNGSGLFATYDFTKSFFAEVSVDYYHATGETVADGMDRLSLYVLGAVGARILPEFIVSPYIQAGLGPEWTRIEVGDHLETTMLAAPFLGLGAEINLGSLKLGAHVRNYAMGLPEHVGTGGKDGHTGESRVQIHYKTAGQAQFFARWEF